MMAGEVTGGTADDSPFDAALGVGWNGRKSNRECERDAAQNRLHVESRLLSFRQFLACAFVPFPRDRNSVREWAALSVWTRSCCLPIHSRIGAPLTHARGMSPTTDKTDGITPPTSDVMDY
jgi:hypothetical protein